MTIYLHYITNAAGEKMLKHGFMQLCYVLGWVQEDIESFLKREGWTFDEDFGFDMDETINVAHAAYDFDNGRNSRKLGFGQPCEGRR
jgi:hypothetical protein